MWWSWWVLLSSGRLDEHTEIREMITPAWPVRHDGEAGGQRQTALDTLLKST
jgi:hypothetical protein